MALKTTVPIKSEQFLEAAQKITEALGLIEGQVNQYIVSGERAQKRRAVAAFTEKGNRNFQEAVNEFLEGGPLLYKSMGEYLDALAETGRDVTEVLTAKYIKNAAEVNKFVMPSDLSDFKVKRDIKTGEITSVINEKEQPISVRQTRGLLAYNGFREQGYEVVIMNPIEGKYSFDALVIGGGYRIVDEASEVMKRRYPEMRTLYTFRMKLLVYLTRQNIVDLLRLDYVTISDVADLLKALNTMAKAGTIRDLDIASLSDVNVIQSKLDDGQAGTTRRKYLATFLASKISKRTSEERLNFFQGSPSYNLANKLSLHLPHQGPCFTKTNNSTVMMVPLESVDLEADVLMAFNPMSQMDYKNLVGDAGKYLVMVDSEEIGARLGNKRRVKTTEKARNVLKMLTVIMEANKVGLAPPPSVVAVAPAPVGTADDIFK